MDIITSFLKQCKSSPNNIAVSEKGDHTTYAHLREIAFQYANCFFKHSVYPKVLIYLNQGIEAYAAMLGTLIAGGYYCPVNIDLPKKKNIK